MSEKVLETLEKQLQLLSERSHGVGVLDCDGLAKLTNAMSGLAEVILRFRSPCA